MENEGYRIGEVSAIHGIPIKTLRYYDDFGLFKPAHIDPQTNYRYYSREQFEKLRLIKYMKGLGLSLAEIKVNLNSLSANAYVETLEHHCKLLETQIKQSHSSLRIITRRVDEIKIARSAPKNKALITEEEPIPLIIFPYTIRCKNDLELAVAQLQRDLGSEIKVGRFGQLVTNQNLLAHDYVNFGGIFLYADENPHYAHRAEDLPGGLTATMYYSRKTNDSIPYWELLMREIDSFGFEPSGDAYRTIVLESGIGIEDEDYLARIRLPIRLK